MYLFVFESLQDEAPLVIQHPRRLRAAVGGSRGAWAVVHAARREAALDGLEARLQILLGHSTIMAPERTRGNRCPRPDRVRNAPGEVDVHLVVVDWNHKQSISERKVQS